ncbi:MAG TPA: protein-L-isoaspartate(D-aspartate) O-methyltransferase [Peptococcaceae bacterium]|nr:protein-L-isoaspartate(D-aspartate) O-methyltransferase [Peptococcaceae bacterium]
MNNWRELATKLVEEHIAPQGVRDPQILEAVKRVPRHLFVPEEMRRYSYYDSPLAIGEGQTISQPYMVARMTELLALKAGDKVLEIGTGSGYQAAVLAEMGMKVTTLERIEKLALKAKDLLQKLDYDVTCIVGDGREGYPENAPYRGVIVTAGAQEIAEAWLDQLDEGGRIVVPLIVQEGLYRLLVRQKDSSLKKGYLDTWDDYCRFVPLLPGVKKLGGA